MMQTLSRPADVEQYTFAFQPIVSIDDESVRSYEALVRGRDGQAAASVLGRYREDELSQFDAAARDQAIEMAAALNIGCSLSLNLLPSCLEALPGTLQDAIGSAHTHGMDPSMLIIEVSETEAIADLALFERQVRYAREAGVRFALDDFGAGFSGLSLLADFQPHIVKLDVRLVRDIWCNGPRQAIVRGVMATCTDLGIDVVAEGVESIDEYEWLHDAGVGLFQGFLFAEPGFQFLPDIVLPN